MKRALVACALALTLAAGLALLAAAPASARAAAAARPSASHHPSRYEARTVAVAGFVAFDALVLLLWVTRKTAPMRMLASWVAGEAFIPTEQADVVGGVGSFARPRRGRPPKVF